MRCANRYKHTQWEWTSWIILLFLPSAFPFRLLLPSLSSFFPPLSCSLNLSLSLCEGHAIDFPLSIHFSRLALKRGKQTKATPAPPLHPSPLLHPPPFPFLSAGPRPVQTPPQQGRAWRNAPSPLLSLSLSIPSIGPFPSSPSCSPFQLDIWPHSTNRIKVMHHT